LTEVTTKLTTLFIFKSFFTFRATRLIYNEQLAATEERIESKRVDIYGGDRLDPSISTWWQMAHHTGIQKTLQQAMNASKKMAGFDKAVVNH
jgi:hypothetical protein